MTTVEVPRAPVLSAAPLISFAFLIAVVTCAVIAIPGSGVHTSRMAGHIVLMNVVAPLAATLLFPLVAKSRSTSTLWTIAILQITAVWIWHAPAVHHTFSQLIPIRMAGDLLLLMLALLFWRSVLEQRGTARWQAIAALLLTGKLVCLLAALLIFAPRLVYGHGATLHHSFPADVLADQQLAGLLMVTACPLSYIGTAIVLVARLLGEGASPKLKSP